MLLPPITKKQQHILILIYRFRFLNRIQLQTLLNHKDYHRINIWLKDLYIKKYLGRIYEYKLGEINKPAIYYLKTNGITYLRGLDIEYGIKHSLLKRLAREHKKSQQFINHNIAIGQLYCLFLTYTRQSNRTLKVLTAMDMIDHTILGSLLPSAYVKVKDKHRKAKRYLIEIFKEGMPRFAIRYKISHYLHYYEEQMWQDTTSYPFPTILFVCPDDKRYEKDLYKLTRRLVDAKDIDVNEVNIIITTMDEVAAYGVDDLACLRMEYEW